MKFKHLIILFFSIGLQLPLAIQSKDSHCHQPVADLLDLTIEARIRLLKAEIILDRMLSPKQEQAILKAHRVGLGEVGEDGTPARIGNYTDKHRRNKALILRDAGFSLSERRLLMENGIVGLFYGLLDSLGISHGHSIGDDLLQTVGLETEGGRNARLRAMRQRHAREREYEMHERRKKKKKKKKKKKHNISEGETNRQIYSNDNEQRRPPPHTRQRRPFDERQRRPFE